MRLLLLYSVLCVAYSQSPWLGREISFSEAGFTKQFPCSVATDDDAMYVVFQAEGNGAGFTSLGSYDVFVHKTAMSNGATAWKRRFGSVGFDTITATAIFRTDLLPAPVLVMAGISNASFHGGTHFGGKDVVLLALSSSGSVEWLIQTGTLSNDGATCLAVDETNGLIFVGGTTFGQISQLDLHRGGADGFIMFLDHQGAPLRTVIVGSSGNDFIDDISHAGDSVFVVGFSSGNLCNLSNSRPYNLFLSRVSKQGSVISCLFLDNSPSSFSWYGPDPWMAHLGEPGMRATVGSLLSSEGYLVSFVSSGWQIYRVSQNHSVIIIDLGDKFSSHVQGFVSSVVDRRDRPTVFVSSLFSVSTSLFDQYLVGVPLDNGLTVDHARPFHPDQNFALQSLSLSRKGDIIFLSSGAGSHSYNYGQSFRVNFGGCRPGEGMQQTSEANLNCSVCGSGSYGIGGGLHRCLACPAGRFSSAHGLTSSDSCSLCQGVGFFASAGSSSCSVCPAGSFCPTTSTRILCPAGRYSNQSGLTFDNCGDCSGEGMFAPAGSVSCSECGQGAFCPNTSVREFCNQGQYSTASRATSSSTCITCPAGSYCPSLSERISCTAGSYNPNPSSTSPCTICPAGFACSFEASSPLQCTSGTYSAPGSSECLGCPAGFYCANPALNPAPCPSGTFNAVQNASAPGFCESCPPGTLCIAGSSFPLLCPSGFYCPTPAQRFFCPAGTFSSSLNATSASICQPCPPGTFSNALNATAIGTCRLCPPGSFCSNATASQLCPPGTFNPVANATSCLTCPAGLLCQGPGNTAAAECPRGSFCSNATASQLCPPGTFNPVANATSCSTCPTGSLCQGPGNLLPSPCPRGSLCPEATVSQLCPSGTFNPVANATSCTACPIGSLCLESGRDAPAACPRGSFCPSPTSQFLCPSGTFSEELNSTHSSTCLTCDLRQNCVFPGTGSRVFCPAGYLPSASGTCSVPCSNCAANGICFGGFIGIACNECPSGCFEDSRRCKPCQSLATVIVIVLIGLAAAALLLMSTLRPTKTHVIAARSLTHILQVLGSLSLLKIPWPKFFDAAMSALMFTGLDSITVNPDCFAFWNIMSSFRASLYVPAAVFLLLYVSFALKRFWLKRQLQSQAQHGGEPGDSSYRLVKLFDSLAATKRLIALISTLMIFTQVKYAFALFPCIDGSLAMDSSVRCDSLGLLVHRILAGFYLAILFLAVLPYLCVSLVWYSWKKQDDPLVIEDGQHVPEASSEMKEPHPQDGKEPASRHVSEPAVGIPFTNFSIIDALSEPYKMERAGFEVMQLLRKILLLVLVVPIGAFWPVVGYPLASLVSVGFAGYVAGAFPHRPKRVEAAAVFRVDYGNWLELLGASVFALSLLLATVLVVSDAGEQATEFAAASILAINGIVVLFALAPIAAHFFRVLLFHCNKVRPGAVVAASSSSASLDQRQSRVALLCEGAAWYLLETGLSFNGKERDLAEVYVALLREHEHVESTGESGETQSWTEALRYRAMLVGLLKGKFEIAKSAMDVSRCQALRELIKELESGRLDDDPLTTFEREWNKVAVRIARLRKEVFRVASLRDMKQVQARISELSAVHEDAKRIIEAKLEAPNLGESLARALRSRIADLETKSQRPLESLRRQFNAVSSAHSKRHPPGPGQGLLESAAKLRGYGKADVEFASIAREHLSLVEKESKQFWAALLDALVLASHPQDMVELLREFERLLVAHRNPQGLELKMMGPILNLDAFYAELRRLSETVRSSLALSSFSGSEAFEAQNVQVQWLQRVLQSSRERLAQLFSEAAANEKAIEAAIAQHEAMALACRDLWRRLEDEVPDGEGEGAPAV